MAKSSSAKKITKKATSAAKKNIKKSIDVWVLGDFGPFSRTGKSIGYLAKPADDSFLVDCGAPLFDMLGGHEINAIDGLIVTHCHDDHKRWFTDLALFHLYAPDIDKKLFLLTTMTSE